MNNMHICFTVNIRAISANFNSKLFSIVTKILLLLHFNTDITQFYSSKCQNSSNECVEKPKIECIECYFLKVTLLKVTLTSKLQFLNHFYILHSTDF